MNPHQGACPVVTIETENGPVEINESDFDAKKHKLSKGQKAPAGASGGSKTDEKPAGLTIGKNGKKGAGSKFVVKDAEGKQVGTDEYDTAEAAQAFLNVLQPPAPPEAPPAGSENQTEQ